MLGPDCVSVLTLQPFYGGSHRQFIDGWIRHSRHAWTLLSLPARHWKWRMRHAAVTWAEEVDKRWRQGERWQVVFCTDMLNLAEWKGLLRSEARDLPTVIYFHENQLAYPDRNNDPRDLHFAFTNFTSALAADRAWFNSRFNLQTMWNGLQELSRQWPDFAPRDAIDRARGKSCVEYPGIETDLDSVAASEVEVDSDRRLRLLWAARWEHDKRPEDLLILADGLADAGIDFDIRVLGQQFARHPPCFETIRRRHGGRIAAWGYQPTRRAYLNALREANVFVSTAEHEFFGLATAEAIAAGCLPMVPDRLAYPELLNVEAHPSRRAFLYGTIEQAIRQIPWAIQDPVCRSQARQLTHEIRRKLSWSTRGSALDQALGQLAYR